MAGEADERQLSDTVNDRRELATKVVRFSGWAIIIISVAIIAGTALIYWKGGDASFTADDAIGSLQGLLSTVLPLFGAWVGAVIAFYFARENLDAAAQNTRALLRQVQPDKLQSIPASQVMIPLNRMEVVKTKRRRLDRALGRNKEI